jgi:hypothetical protein
MRHRILSLALVAGVTSACALRPPVQSSGPSISQEGIAVAVVGQRCEQGREPDRNNPLAEVTVLVRVHNPTRDAATIHRTDFRLVGDERYALRTRSWGAAEPLRVEPGADETFDLRFMARGAFECAKELRLDPGTGVVTRDRVVKLLPVSFVPRRV